MYIRVSNGYVRRHKVGSGLKISPSNVEKVVQAIKSISISPSKISKPKPKQYIKF